MIFLYFLGVLHRESEGFMILKRISRWISVHLNNTKKTLKLFGVKLTKFGELLSYSKYVKTHYCYTRRSGNYS
jgi:hypothetical protein